VYERNDTGKLTEKRAKGSYRGKAEILVRGYGYSLHILLSSMKKGAII
jgi:hypothetical protein